MKLHNIKSAYSLANTLYGVNINPDLVEDILLNGWQLIGNKYTKFYKYITKTIDKQIQLPCNVDLIEIVTTSIEDAQLTSDLTIFPSAENQFFEQYNEAWKRNKSILYQSGKMIHYHEEGDDLIFTQDYNKILILYRGIIVDEEGLPLITDKEVTALAAYLSYIDLYRKSLVLKDGNFMQLAQTVKQDWLRACNDARVPMHLSQNNVDDILDSLTRWDRKRYNKSYKLLN